MNAEFSNIYDDSIRADAYAKLGYPGTYYLAYRDLPAIIEKHVRGTKALDFGCGTGRSTRFLRDLGFNVVGVDSALQMLSRALAVDPQGDYRLVPDDYLSNLPTETFDLVLSAFTFDNIPTLKRKVRLFRSLKRVLKASGCIVSVVSTPAIYVHEWASFSTKDFPENRKAQSGDKVRIVMLDVEDRRPVEDIHCTDEDYQAVYRRAGLVPISTYRPLGKPSEPYTWVSETAVPPWSIYVLEPAPRANVRIGHIDSVSAQY
jgi:ubiquinone/menaquinone biosynthesis C-methylase UbiE